MKLPGFVTATIAACAMLAAQTPQKAPPARKTPAQTAPAVSDADITAAKAKGMVWVNTNSRVYHKDGRYYGRTKAGKFMTEDDAKKAGFHAAQEGATGKHKSATPAKNPPDKK